MNENEIMEELASRYKSWIRSNLETSEWSRGYQDCMDMLADSLGIDQVTI